MKAGDRQRILMTGAAGRVGNGIAADLARDHDLVLTDARVPEERRDSIAPLDILDFDAVAEACVGVDQVLHLAIASDRMLGHLSAPEHADEVMRVNVMGTQHVFEAAARAGVKRVVYFSSMTIVLGEPRYPRIERDTPPRPRGVYGCTKLFGEHLADHYARTRDLSIICVRLGQPFPTPEIARDSPPFLSNAGNGFYCDFADVVRGVRCALSASDVKYIVFNLVSGAAGKSVDLSAGREIGYWPGKYFTENGQVVDNRERPEEIN